MTLGTNILVGHDMDRLQFEVRQILNGSRRKEQVPPLWDGHAAERIAGDHDIALRVGPYSTTLSIIKL
jgi:hypothetical protein